MKISVRKIFVLLAVILSFFAIQAVWAGQQSGQAQQNGPACTETVEGTVTAIDYEAKLIVVDTDDDDIGDITVYGIPLNYLTDLINVNTGDVVITITAHYCPSQDKLVACTLSLDGGATIIDLRGKNMNDNANTTDYVVSDTNGNSYGPYKCFCECTKCCDCSDCQDECYCHCRNLKPDYNE